jgi:hypothetical protein
MIAMTIDKLNPVFVYRNREHILPYLSRRRERLVHGWKLRQFRDRHRGGRCFVIGNGPSLTLSDLDQLKSEVSFAANKIYLAFNQTDWRPSYYVVEDDHMIWQHHEDIIRLRGLVKFVSNNWTLEQELGVRESEKERVRQMLCRDREVVFYPRVTLEDQGFPRFSGDACRALYCGYMVTYISLQLAYFMGFTNVYLIGVDFKYSQIDQGSNTFAHAAHHPQDHFTPDYFSPGEKRYVPQLAHAERALVCARNFYEAQGRKVWNATRGGALEVFDRLSLEEVLGK